jgi:hypothetical protein
MTVYLHRFSGVLPAGDIFSFGWHSVSTAGLAGANINARTWLSNFWTAGLPAVEGIYNPGVVFNRVTTYELNAVAPFHTSGIAESDVTEAGSSAANSLPQDVVPLVTLRSLDPTRHGRGRFSLPAPDITTVTADGELSTSARDTLLGSLLGAWAISNAAGEQPVIFNKATGFPTVITRFGMGTVLDIQTRRVNKVSTVRSFDDMP